MKLLSNSLPSIDRIKLLEIELNLVYCMHTTSILEAFTSTLTASCLAIEFSPLTFQFSMCAGSITNKYIYKGTTHKSNQTLHSTRSATDSASGRAQPNRVARALVCEDIKGCLKHCAYSLRSCWLICSLSSSTFRSNALIEKLFLHVCGAILSRCRGEASKTATAARLLARWLQLLLPSFADVGDRQHTPWNLGQRPDEYSPKAWRRRRGSLSSSCRINLPLTSSSMARYLFIFPLYVAQRSRGSTSFSQ